MSLEYANKRIQEALKQHNGNQAKARQQVIAWTYEDTKLLHALTQHHLSGIVAYHVERVASGRSTKPQTPEPKAKPKVVVQDEEFGTEILKAVAGNAGAQFGLEGYSVPQKRGQASQRHINAIQQIASTRRPKKK